MSRRRRGAVDALFEASLRAGAAGPRGKYNTQVRFSFRAAAACVIAGLAAVAASGQSAPATPLRVVSAEGTRPLPTIVSGDTELVALDDLVSLFGVTVREDALARAITVAYKGKTIVVSQDQALASIAGRLVSLPAAPSRIRGRWHLPVEFIGRALSSVYDVPLDLRKASRLVIRGPLRVPRVVVGHDAAGSQARVTLDVSPATAHQVVQQSGRLVVRFEADLLDVSLPPVESQGLVQAITADQTSVVIATGPRFASFRASDQPAGGGASRVVLDLLAADPAPPPTSTEGPAAPGPAAPPPPLPAAGVRIVVIDPGHGGEDAGATGARGTAEKTVTLSVARRLKAMLESRLGARVLLTRDDDRTLGLDQRAAIANNNKADVFVSLHANASLLPAVAGAEVFSLGLDPSDDQVRRAAESTGVAMPVFGGGTRDIDVLLWELAQARHVPRSAELAAAVEAQLRAAVPMSPQGMQQAPLRVLVGANMPAVLVELGYLTNAGQETSLTSAPFQSQLSQAITEAIARFFITSPGENPPATVGAP